MNESVYDSINKAHEMLRGIKDAGGRLTTDDLNFLCGLLEGTLKPYTMPEKAIERAKLPWYKRVSKGITG